MLPVRVFSIIASFVLILNRNEILWTQLFGYSRLSSIINHSKLFFLTTTHTIHTLIFFLLSTPAVIQSLSTTMRLSQYPKLWRYLFPACTNSSPQNCHLPPKLSPKSINCLFKGYFKIANDVELNSKCTLILRMLLSIRIASCGKSMISVCLQSMRRRLFWTKKKKIKILIT